ncbi:uncharacterized protein MYCFIDRAFT_44255 [Pseudocercospora fijiensis CIRAD86]|uniref:GST N-terminal domain-containing protein n=1 Tax=Pseudocercospora fijiensis (strain CIRAD86) TaxID=383855 RepID=M3B377_PSEFD|nr:uncharacterized protein MYCFIDRAFT_44255 [Pseudocercospora fijiensis CIRAD86]EME83833.1 hypothetical protein MYCFIDRAFT_44255 [Pseudocercospora fijiensis CIRAD86]
MASTSLPKEWHSGPDDSFHGKITDDGPFNPEKDRYHLYIALFCPFAHRVNLVLHLKQLHKYAGIETSIVRPYPKGDAKGWPGWRFNVEDKKDEADKADYEGATVDKLFGSKYMHELYFKADKDYKGRYSVPVLWDKKLNTIVNNESHELLRDLQTAFNSLLPKDLADITLYPEPLRAQIDHLGEQLQQHLNTGVYKAGFAPDQATYEKNLPPVFAILNKLEKLTSSNAGPYILGPKLTEIDIRTFCTLIRFDVVYVQHFKCNLGMLRYSYPTLYNWLKGLYWNLPEARDTTDFRHIKENYTKSHYDINPRGITPLGPWPDIDRGFERDWGMVGVGGIEMEEVLEFEERLGKEVVG